MPRPKRTKVASTVAPARVASKPSSRKPAVQSEAQDSNEVNSRRTRATKMSHAGASNSESDSTPEDQNMIRRGTATSQSRERPGQHTSDGVQAEVHSDEAVTTVKTSRTSRSRTFNVSTSERQASEHSTDSTNPRPALPTVTGMATKTTRASRSKFQSLGLPADAEDVSEQHPGALFHERATQLLSSPKSSRRDQMATTVNARTSRPSRSKTFQVLGSVVDREDDAGEATAPVIPSTNPVIRPSSRAAGHTPRAQTPPAAASTDDEDLYGLSPSGEISRAKIEQSKRESLAQPQSALKAVGTPAIETSVLALTKFKRRARQPSMISLVQQSTDLGDLDEFELDDFDDFDPENESTPLNLTKSKDTASSPAVSDSLQQSATRTSSSKKRKSSDQHHQSPDSLPKIRRLSPSTNKAGSHSVRRTRSSNTGTSELSSLSEPNGSSFIAVEGSEPMSSTMAPPLSSPAASSPEPSPTKGGQLRRTTTTSSQTQRRRLTKIPTQKLQSLMPRTRHRLQRTADTFEISSEAESDSAIHSEPDERSHPSNTRTNPAGPSKMKKSNVNHPAAPAKLKAKPRRPIAAVQTSSTPIPTSSRKPQLPRSSKSGRRTYGRSNDDDKENEESYNPVEDTTDDIEDTTVRASVDPVWAMKRTKLQAKFAEVDAWEMEFENVDMSQASSPWR